MSQVRSIQWHVSTKVYPVHRPLFSILCFSALWLKSAIIFFSHLFSAFWFSAYYYTIIQKYLKGLIYRKLFTCFDKFHLKTLSGGGSKEKIAILDFPCHKSVETVNIEWPKHFWPKFDFLYGCTLADRISIDRISISPI